MTTRKNQAKDTHKSNEQTQKEQPLGTLGDNSKDKADDRQQGYHGTDDNQGGNFLDTGGTEAGNKD